MTLQKLCSSCCSLLLPEFHECITCFISLSVEILSTGSQAKLCPLQKKKKVNWPNYFVLKAVQGVGVVLIALKFSLFQVRELEVHISY